MGATRDGTKELIAVTDGYRESEQSWRELLLDVRARGLTIDSRASPSATGASASGAPCGKCCRKPVSSGVGSTRRRTCSTSSPRVCNPRRKPCFTTAGWPRRRRRPTTPSPSLWRRLPAKFPAATTCLVKDRDVLLTFYAFPAEHWMHIRTTNPVESTFATVRLRTRKTKGAGSRLACLTMVFKLAMAAQKQWRALNGSQLIAEVIDGGPFVDGVRQKAA